MTFYTNFIRYLYTVLYYFVVPVLLFRMFWRSLRQKINYMKNWTQRFGFIPQVSAHKVIWLHAVSVGEILAAVPMIKALLKSYPHYQMVLTSTTPTGAAQAIKHFAGKALFFYTPYDLPGSVQRFLKRTHPDLGIILETELWPNLLAACRGRQVPLLLANARLSLRSLRGYRRVAPLAEQMVNSFALVAAQSAADGERFLALGLSPEKLQVTGNIKFDIEVGPDLMTQGASLRKEWGGHRFVWVAASTHEGEEKIILEAFQLIRKAFPSTLLILAPRHPQRFPTVKQLCLQGKWATAMYSQKGSVTLQTQILLVDTMGELMKIYAAADLAFVGGSLIPRGGHNLIEPAVLGVPVLTGPEVYNFADVSQLLLNTGGAKIVKDEHSMAEVVMELFEKSQDRLRMGSLAQDAIMKNKGALAKHLSWIRENMID